ncbi:MAG: ATP-binding protein [Coxiellaceae bacterium]|nr:ATP-binding protein [Coxiellaceae bacterium]
MTKQIIQALMDWNPWLEGKFPEELIGYERDYDLLPLLEVPEIKIVEGARRVGKSTLFYQLIARLIEQQKKVIYINFDDDELSQHPLKTIYYAYQQHDDFDYLFIDEVQECQQWVHFIRQLYDTKQIKQIWISGSNSSLIKQEFKKLLTGRNITREINTLSFNEFLRFKRFRMPANKALSSKKEVEVFKLFDDYVRFGAFPAVALREVYQKELLVNYFEDILYKDIVPRYEVNVNKIKELALYLASNNTKNYSYRSIGNALGLHPKTVGEYINYFTDVFLFSELHKFDYSLKGQLSSDKKIYAIDSGIAAANAFKFSDDRGRMLENVVYSELKRRGHQVYFHKQKKECDFLIKDQLDVTQAIQVTVSLEDEKTKQREINGLLDALEYHKLESGLILTENEEDTIELMHNDKKYHVTVLPIWQWSLVP